ncbi:MAG TPA: HAD family hydrolase [Dehalococcoidia bacterium]|nr:HAD family hydrolase [Dehalococcoidia bacterium]
MALNSRRLYLFDIDGTLITSGGAGSGAMRAAFAALWRRDDGFSNIEFSGRTDRWLFRQAHAGCGFEDAAFPADLQRFKRAYRRRLHQTLRSCEGRVLPGVVNVLERLAEDGDATLALGTGNFRSTAAVKLGYYNLAHYFRAGGFGDDTDDRAELIGNARRAAERLSGRHDTVFVIGDTVHDVSAAKANGFVAVAVATGVADTETLSAAGADVVLPTLESAAELLARHD